MVVTAAGALRTLSAGMVVMAWRGATARSSWALVGEGAHRDAARERAG